MIPESKLIKSEILLRELALQEDVLLTRKSTVRWLALSLGLINPNESRTVVIDLLDVLFSFHYEGKRPTTKDILGKMSGMSGEEQNSKAVYYHLQRLMDLGMLNREKGEYFFGDGTGGSLAVVFKKLYDSRTTTAFSGIDRAFSRIARE
ncbi:MAG: hypothetical protein V1492_00435 [Candidatus Micrarchaeota archaeon]